MRFIDPERFKDRRIPRFDGAILPFRDRYASSLIKFILDCKGIEQKIPYGIDPNDVHRMTVNSSAIIVVEQLIRGGPQAAILVEELAALWVRRIIGLGACGSMAASLKRGDVVFAAEAFAADGTSRYYTDAASIGLPLDIVSPVNRERCRPAKSATIDALFQERHEVIERFRELGADIINMESAALYAVAARLELSAIWIGNVSDVLVERKWDSWFDSKSFALKGAEAAMDFAGRYFA
jgi:uridine phosphorylase